MRLYLAGPMTGIEDYNYPAFHEAAARWRSAGHTIVNPAESFGGDQGKPKSVYMRWDISEILGVDGLVVLPGWQSSSGASLEVAIANAIDKPVYDAMSDPASPALYHEEIEEEARRLVSGDRNVQYGDAEEDFRLIGKVWSGILGIDVSPVQVGLCMAGLKLVREAWRAKRDNRVDAIGYLLCVERIRQIQAQRG